MNLSKTLYFNLLYLSQKSDGCTFVKETILNIICSCIHLTDFTAQMIPDQVKSTQKLADFTETVKQGNSLLKSQAGKKIVVSSLPPLKLDHYSNQHLGQRSVNLVNQLNILQNGGALNLLKKHTIILNDYSLYDEIAEESEKDHITIEVIKPQDQKQIQEGYFKNQIEIIFYLTIVFVIFFFFSMRANINFNFIKLSQKQIKMYEANYYEQIQENITQKTEVRRDNRKKTYQMKQNNQTEKQKQKQKLNAQKQNSNQVKKQNNKQSSLNKSSNPSKEQIHSNNSLTEDEQKSIHIPSQTSIIASNKYNPTKKSAFSKQKQSFAQQIQVQSEHNIFMPSNSELYIIESESSIDNKNKEDFEIQHSIDYKRHQTKKTTFFKNQELLNTIIEVDQDNNSINQKEENKNNFQSNQSLRNKSKKNTLKFNSMQIIKAKDAEYENYIQENQHKPINPLWQSKKNKQKATKILNKLKRNQQILKDNTSVLRVDGHSIQNEKSQQHPSETNINCKNDDKNIQKYIIESQQPYNPHEEKLKSNHRHKFLIQLQKMKETNIQIEQLQKEKRNLQEYTFNQKTKTEIKENDQQIQKTYKITQNNLIIFNESTITIKLKEINEQKAKEQKLKQDILHYKRKNKNNYEEIQYQIEADQVVESINEAIRQKQQYIHFIDNLIDQHLKVNPKNILQIYSLQQHDEKFLSNRLTKCIYFICQILLSMTAQIILTQGMTQSVSFNSLFGKFEFYITRTLAITAISYLIPYFIFGCLTSIFAQSSKQLKHLDFRSINQLRNAYIACYVSLGLMQVILYLLLIYYESKDALLGNQFTISTHILEVFISFITSVVIIDSLFYLLFTLLLSDNAKTKSGFINNLLACRGFYYYQGFDNIVIYEQFFLANTIKSI